MVRDIHHLGATTLGFLSSLPDSSRWGAAVTGIGDLNGDGVPELVAGHSTYNGGRGAVWVLFMNEEGGVDDHVLISNSSGGLGAVLDPGDSFGSRVTNAGDLNTDGRSELAVIASGDDDGGTDHGAVHILFLTDSGTVSSTSKISDTQGGFTGTMTNGNRFAGALGGVGDLNGDTIPDLAVGSYLSNTGGSQRGALWILHMKDDGTVESHQQISSQSTWPGGSPLANSSQFGFSVCGLGDLDGNGHQDIAVTARYHYNGPGLARGRVWILFRGVGGSISAVQAIAPGGTGGLATTITGAGGHFGWSIANAGDVNGDGVVDMLISARQQDVDHINDGALFIGYLTSAGTLSHEEMISENDGLQNDTLDLQNYSYFGASAALLGDISGDGSPDLAVSASHHPSGGTERGKVYVLELEPKPMIVEVLTSTAHLDTLAAVDINVLGGARPYRYILGDPLVVDSVLTGWADAADTSGLASIGVPTWGLFRLDRSHVQPILLTPPEALPTGSYKLLVIDAASDTAETAFTLGQDLQAASAEQVTLSDGHRVTKTGSSGWADGRWSGRNTVCGTDRCWVQFRAAAEPILAAVGLSPFGAAALDGYEQMTYGILLSGDSVQIIHGGSLHSTTASVNTEEEYMVELTDGQVHFSNTQGLLASFEQVHGADCLSLDVAIHTSGTGVVDLRTDAPASFTVRDSLVHGGALDPSSGAVHLTFLPDTGSYSTTWNNAAGASSRSGLGTETWSTRSTSTYFGVGAPRVVHVGQRHHWEEATVHAVRADQRGQTIARKSGGTGWGPVHLTVNSSNTLVDHRLLCVPVVADTARPEFVAGWRAEGDSSVVASWLVRPFGPAWTLAHAIGPDSALTSVLVRPMDELQIVSTVNGRAFLLNQDTVAIDSTTAPVGPFRTMIAFRDTLSEVQQVRGSMAVPLILSTEELAGGFPLSLVTPSLDTITGISGGQLTAILDPGPVPGDHELIVAATDTTVALTFLFELDSGHVTNVRLVVEDTTYAMDPSQVSTAPPNVVSLFDEPRSTGTEAPAAIHLLLEENFLMTPNDDDHYDEFRVLGVDPRTDYELTITDRQQNILFQTTDAGSAWNGKYMNTGSASADGIYVYRIEVDGEVIEGYFQLKN